jgi:catechol 2,3-dioxygenase-like lactoylglutathione lyase family enzyme
MMSAAATTDGHELYGVEAVLFVPDVRATLTFYRDVLGFNVDFDAGSPEPRRGDRRRPQGSPVGTSPVRHSGLQRLRTLVRR